MKTNISAKTFLHRTAAAFLVAMMLFAALPTAQAGATPLTITSIASGTWEASAWPDTERSGTITVIAGDANVVGTGTAFLTELSVGNILKTAGVTHTQIGTVASITDDTHLTLSNIPGTARTDIAYTVQGVGPADNPEIASGHTVTIGVNAINQTGNVTVDAGGILIVSKIGSVFSTLTVDGSVSADESAAFGELMVNNGGVVDAAGTATTVAYSATSLTINNGGTVNISRDFTVGSETIISGAINFSSNGSNSRAMSFLGPVTLNSDAAWNEPPGGNGSNNSYTFSSDLTNNATTFLATSTASTHFFGGASKTLNGSTSIAKVEVSGTYTNNGTLTAGALSGTGALTNSASGTLNLGGSVSINTLANAGTLNKTGTGSISTALANFTNTGTINLNSTGTITGGITNNAGGIVNITDSGAITNFDNASATSLLNISDLVPPTINNLIVTASGNTVEYSGEGDQTVKSTAYSNLVLSGSGNKLISLISNSTLATGNLSITEMAKASIPGQNLAVNGLSLGGFGKINGTWGSTSSGATNKDDTFFAANTGHVNVATDLRSSQTINFTSTPPTNPSVGGTYTPTATATSGLTVTLTIDPSSSSVCSMSSGEVTFNANGTCLINADQPGDANYLAAPQAQQSILVKTHQTIQFSSTVPLFAEVKGTPYTPTATATSGLPVVFTIDASAASVCSISAGTVSFQAPGTCLINANQSGNTSYYPAPQVQQSFPVRFKQTKVHVTIGTTVPSGSPFKVLKGRAVAKDFAGFNQGPLQVNSTQPVANVIAAERVIYKNASGVPTSLSELMGLPDNQLHTVYRLPWYTSNAAMDTQLQIANVSDTTTTINISIGGKAMPSFSLAAHTSVSKSYPGIDRGPVKIVSTVSTAKIVVSERVIYKVNSANASFSELMALPETQLTKLYWFPWYNSKTLDSQLRIVNLTNTKATINISIGGKPMPSFTVAAGASLLKTYPNIDQGPVKIVSDVKIMASQIMIRKVNTRPVSYTEIMGLPNAQLAKAYWLPWYTKNTSMDSQLEVANASTSPATVHVYINGVEMNGSPFTLAVGGSKKLSFAGVNKGPVQIVSNVPIIAGVGVTYKANGLPTSYSEMIALSNKLLDDTYWFPWYNNKTLTTQMLVGMP